MKVLIKRGAVFNYSAKNLQILDILINGSKIKDIGSNIPDEDALVIDAKDKLVIPGLIDAHVHFRQPGQEYKEDIHTGSLASAAGGFTTVIAEPNTIPATDTPIRLKRLLEIANNASVVNFYSKSCITRRMEGMRLVDVRAMKEAGAKAISDDGHPVYGKQMMENALIKGKEHEILVNPHCEESELYRERVLAKNGVSGQSRFFPMPLSDSEIPYYSEDGFIRRDLELTERTGARIHISHVSLAKSVELIAEAKKRGVKVTAEATPHHLFLTEEMGREIGTNAKVNPPLRSKEDVEAVKEGLANGTIDIIVSDHAPHSPQEKSLPWDKAPFGIIGLETTLGLVLTHLVKPGILTLSQAIEKMSYLPAKIFEIPAGDLSLGTSGDVTIIDLNKKWKVDTTQFYSKGRNCPFDGWELEGKAVTTIVRGRIVMQDGRIISNY